MIEQFDHFTASEIGNSQLRLIVWNNNFFHIVSSITDLLHWWLYFVVIYHTRMFQIGANIPLCIQFITESNLTLY